MQYCDHVSTALLLFAEQARAPWSVRQSLVGARRRETQDGAVSDQTLFGTAVFASSPLVAYLAEFKRRKMPSVGCAYRTFLKSAIALETLDRTSRERALSMHRCAKVYRFDTLLRHLDCENCASCKEYLLQAESVIWCVRSGISVGYHCSTGSKLDRTQVMESRSPQAQHAPRRVVLLQHQMFEVCLIGAVYAGASQPSHVTGRQASHLEALSFIKLGALPFPEDIGTDLQKVWSKVYSANHGAGGGGGDRAVPVNLKRKQPFLESAGWSVVLISDNVYTDPEQLFDIFERVQKFWGKGTLAAVSALVGTASTPAAFTPREQTAAKDSDAHPQSGGGDDDDDNNSNNDDADSDLTWQRQQQKLAGMTISNAQSPRPAVMDPQRTREFLLMECGVKAIDLGSLVLRHANQQRTVTPARSGAKAATSAVAANATGTTNSVCSRIAHCYSSNASIAHASMMVVPF